MHAPQIATQILRPMQFDWHYLLDWQYPLDGGAVKGEFWGLSREDLEKRSAGEVVTERPAAFRRASAQENKPRL